MNNWEPGCRITIMLQWRRTLVLFSYIRQVKLNIGMPMKGSRLWRDADEYC